MTRLRFNIGRLELSGFCFLYRFVNMSFQRITSLKLETLVLESKNILILELNMTPVLGFMAWISM